MKGHQLPPGTSGTWRPTKRVEIILKTVAKFKDLLAGKAALKSYEVTVNAEP
jgi:hypothetical protein